MEFIKEIISIIILVIICSCELEEFHNDVETVSILPVDQDIYYGDTLFIEGLGFNNAKLIKLFEVVENKSSTPKDTNDSSSELNFDTIDVSELISSISAHKISIYCDSIKELKTFFYSIDGEKSPEFKVNFINNLNLQIATVSSGSFTMGSKNGFVDESPLRKVEIPNTLSVSKYEVTNSLWQLVMKDQFRRNEDGLKPAVNLLWEDAIEFCNKASEIDGLEQAYSIQENAFFFNQEANGWRLPTEAEWEYLAKAGLDYDFAGSYEINDVAWFNKNSGFNLQKVGIKLPNENGLFDMNGNALEWCWDFYQRYEPADKVLQNPIGPETGNWHVRRGGAINLPIIWCRNSTRNFTDEGIENTGFRVVRNN